MSPCTQHRIMQIQIVRDEWIRPRSRVVTCTHVLEFGIVVLVLEPRPQFRNLLAISVLVPVIVIVRPDDTREHFEPLHGRDFVEYGLASRSDCVVEFLVFVHDRTSTTSAFSGISTTSRTDRL